MYGSELKAKTLIYTAVFTALIAVGGWISVPLLMVPFTLQTLAVLLAAAVMKRRAILPAALYVLLGTLGLPLFHNGTAGPGILLGPTGGFLIGFMLMAFTAGWFFERGKIPTDIAGLVLAGLLSYACGVGWFWFSTGSGFIAAVAACMIPFLIGDIIKSVAAEIVLIRLRNYEKRND